VIYVLLDDGGGVNPSGPSDNDHDDMIMRFTVTPIPEPATAAMLGLGVAALASRRSKRSFPRREEPGVRGEIKQTTARRCVSRCTLRH